MSSGYEQPRSWLVYLAEMVEFCEKVLQYTEGLGQQAFFDNALVYDATIRNITLIGEAAAQVPGPVRATQENVPWQTIVATRNHMMHRYYAIDETITWSIITSDIPELLPYLRNMLRSVRE